MPPAPPPNLPPSPSPPFAATPPPPPRAAAARPFDHPSLPSTGLSAAHRSMQARNKNFNVSAGKARGVEDEAKYEAGIRRERAGRILESAEMVIWYSCARNESIPQTRQYYQNIVWGFADDDDDADDQHDVVWREEWEVDRETGTGMGIGVGSPRSAKGKEKEKERVGSGKKRVGSGRAVSGAGASADG